MVLEFILGDLKWNNCLVKTHVWNVGKTEKHNENKMIIINWSQLDISSQDWGKHSDGKFAMMVKSLVRSLDHHMSLWLCIPYCLSPMSVEIALLENLSIISVSTWLYPSNFLHSFSEFKTSYSWRRKL